MDFNDVASRFPPPFYVQCPVCLDVMRDPRILPCSHTVCKVCLETLVRYSVKQPPNKPGSVVPCPVCRQEITVISADKMPHNRGLSDAICDWRVRMMSERHRWFRSGLARCLDHNNSEMTAELWCTTCEQNICQICQNDGKHKEHEVEVIEDFDSFNNHRADVLNQCFAAYERLPEMSLQITSLIKRHKGILEGYIKLGEAVDVQEAHAHRILSEKFQVAREAAKQLVTETTEPLVRHRTAGLQTLDMVHTFFTNAHSLMKLDSSKLQEYSDTVVGTIDQFVTTTERLCHQQTHDLTRIMAAPFNRLVFEVLRIGTTNNRTVRDLRVLLQNGGRRRGWSSQNGPQSPRRTQSPRNSRNSPRQGSRIPVQSRNQPAPLDLSRGNREHRHGEDIAVPGTNGRYLQAERSETPSTPLPAAGNVTENSTGPEHDRIALPSPGLPRQGSANRRQMLELMQTVGHAITRGGLNSTPTTSTYQRESPITSAAQSPSESTPERTSRVEGETFTVDPPQVPGVDYPLGGPLGLRHPPQPQRRPSPALFTHEFVDVSASAGPVPGSQNVAYSWDSLEADGPAREDGETSHNQDPIIPPDIDVHMGAHSDNTNPYIYRSPQSAAYHDHGGYTRGQPQPAQIGSFPPDSIGSEGFSQGDLNNSNGNNHDLSYYYYYNHHSSARLRRSYAPWYYDYPPYEDIWGENPYSRGNQPQNDENSAHTLNYAPPNGPSRRGQPSTQGRRRPIRGRTDRRAGETVQGTNSNIMAANAEDYTAEDGGTGHVIPVTNV